MPLSKGVKKEVLLDELIVWTDNPRFDEKYEEDEAITMVFVTATQRKMFDLILDINNNGLLANESIIAVKREDGKYNVYDGNRRISAIKTAQNPSLIKQEKIRDNLIDYLDKYDIHINIDKVEVLITEEEIAKKLILRKHGPQNTGAALQNWSTWSRDNFLFTQLRREPQNKHAYEAVRLLGYNNFSSFRKKYSIDYTNLERIMSNKHVVEYFDNVRTNHNEIIHKKLLDKFILKAYYYKQKSGKSFSRAFDSSKQIQKLLCVFKKEFSDLEDVESWIYKHPKDNIDPKLGLEKELIESKVTKKGETKAFSHLNSSLLYEQYKKTEINIGPNSNACFLELKNIKQNHMKLFPISFLSLIRVTLEISAREFHEKMGLTSSRKYNTAHYIFYSEKELEAEDFHPLTAVRRKTIRKFVREELAVEKNDKIINGPFLNELHRYVHNTGAYYDLRKIKTNLNDYVIPFIIAMSNHIKRTEVANM